MKNTLRKLELLAPAADKNVAIQAILHGADAVYIGGPSHGARSKAANSVEDIAEVVRFAHQFRARVYVTLNTLVYESEIKEVEALVHEMYRIGVDALIVQDMSLLRMKLPPIALHASTQCDTRTVKKAKFLEDVGFSQIVLARELSLAEIKDICHNVSVPVECFVHGALCVSYSGRCAASQVELGRSANRGQCAQMCRMPYSLRNGRGEIVEKDKHLLSLRDFNASGSLREMILAGVSSFKIEGRMKDADYVKNITASYRAQIDSIIAEFPDKFCRSSYGESFIDFTPKLDKSFNRGFTDYFLNGRKQASMASLLTPKSMGEVVKDVNILNNGDGISFFNHNGEYVGVGVNKVENGRIIGSRQFKLPKGAEIHRTLDRQWQKVMSRDTAQRKVKVDISVDEEGITACDERGVSVRIFLDVSKSEAHNVMQPRPIFEKLGGTIYVLNNFENKLLPQTFIPASQLTALRRRLVKELDQANESTYKFDYRRPENTEAVYVSQSLDSRDNVANSLAVSFYRDHGVKKIISAVEVNHDRNRQTVMTTRYCLRRELGCCLKDKSVSPEKRKRYAGPLSISTGPHTFDLEFDCARCEMNVLSRGRNSQ